MNVLVVAAHPDDEVLGCGGTIAAHSRAGDDVTIAILGEGITSRAATREGGDTNALSQLRDNAQSAAHVLGANHLELVGLPDQRLDTLPLLDVVKVIEEIVRRVNPQRVYTHHGGDLNLDHTVVHRATLTATRGTEDSPVRDVYAFETPSSTEWSFGQFTPVFVPNAFVDITATLGTKLDAMACYEGEARVVPHPRASESLAALAQFRGVAVGIAAAEAFMVVRKVETI